MKISYKNDASDVWTVIARRMVATWVSKLFWLAILTLYLGAILVPLWLPSRHSREQGKSLGGYVFPFLPMIVIPAAIAIGARKVTKQIVPVVLTLTAEGIAVEAGHSSGITKWSGITGVIRTRRRIIVTLTNKSAHVVPRRAFSDDVAFDQFYQTCLDRLEAARILEGEKP